MMVKMTLIVPTLNRKKELDLLLCSLKDQIDNKEIEIIIIDQNEVLDVTKVINKHKNKLKIIHIKTKPIGASAARNIGISKAEGEYLAFPDDDCEFPKGMMKKIMLELDSLRQCDGITIITRDKFDNKPIAKLRNNSLVLKKKNLLNTVIEAGIIVKRNKVEESRFDEEMGVGSKMPYWSDEGPDFILQLIEKGLCIRYIPSLYMYHPNPTRIYSKETIKRAYNYGLGRGYFLRKNNYPFYVFVKYIIFYMIGYFIGLIKMNRMMRRYFIAGIKGRYEGFYLKKK